MNTKKFQRQKYQNLEQGKLHTGSSVPLITTECLKFWLGWNLYFLVSKLQPNHANTNRNIFGFDKSSEYIVTNCYWLLLIYSGWFWLIPVDADCFWLILIDPDWCCLMLIDADWCWLILIDAGCCWLILIDTDCY